jgi:hypothetical protein
VIEFKAITDGVRIHNPLQSSWRCKIKTGGVAYPKAENLANNLFCSAVWLFCTSGRKIEVNIGRMKLQGIGGLSMKRIIIVGCSMVLALILMDTYQVVNAPSGLAVVKAGQAFAADMTPPPPPPVAAPIGKGKAPVLGKGKAPIIGKGKGKAPPPPVITKG